MEILSDLPKFRESKKPQSFYDSEFPANALRKAPKLDMKALSLLDWTFMDEETVFNRWRAFESTRTFFRDNEVLIQKMASAVEGAESREICANPMAMNSID